MVCCLAVCHLQPRFFEGISASVWVALGLHHSSSTVSLLFCHGESPSKTSSPAMPLWHISVVCLLPPAAAAQAEVPCTPLTGCSFGVWGKLCACSWFLLTHSCLWLPHMHHNCSTLLIKPSCLCPVCWHTSNSFLKKYVSGINCIVKSLLFAFLSLPLQMARLLQYGFKVKEKPYSLDCCKMLGWQMHLVEAGVLTVCFGAIDWFFPWNTIKQIWEFSLISLVGKFIITIFTQKHGVF